MDESPGASLVNVSPRQVNPATPELCQVIESLVETRAVPPMVNLGELRKALVEGIFIGDGEMLYPQDRTFLVIELDELIERDGADTPARAYTAGARAG
jgi:hypothetical protein